MKQMEISGYSVWRTLQAIDPDATFSKHEHTAYALESNLNKVCTWKRLMFPHWILQWVLGNKPSSIQLVENQAFSSAHHFLRVLTVEVQYWIIKNRMWTCVGAIPIVCTCSNCVWVISLQFLKSGTQLKCAATVPESWWTLDLNGNCKHAGKRLEEEFYRGLYVAYRVFHGFLQAMYHCFENDSFDDTGLTLIIDPNKRCEARFAEFQRMRLVDAVDAANLKHRDFEPKFLAFCERKMREMWFLFPWNIVFKDAEERKLFTGAFLDAAKCIWLLHRLAFSLQPVATILRVGKGMEINPLYVETIVPSTTGCEKCGVAKVQFMTMPGFQVNHTVIRCQVYQHLQCR